MGERSSHKKPTYNAHRLTVRQREKRIYPGIYNSPFESKRWCGKGGCANGKQWTASRVRFTACTRFTVRQFHCQ